ncbi:transcriptional regulator, IclR family [Dethiosulfatibacter aminovorans DSM 17477]|uniref:Glycerol operon regulatory protein n=1 Tax=Dethiosulfatibacter aminovorans DSM 17477 TaxID=1121476 RepID=A0A1M6C212_9FIRM|nr:IclR family transcriptional regulator [Dethiosulfatibacter aminovorans]SHI55095.1 transcriptional regulator, IclR family [Dethiosulfatibacter aminovorans DSM 17477]
MANKNGVTVQSVVRALKILELFVKNKELSITEISEKMDLSKSTVYGLVNTLTIKGFLEQYDVTKKYKLGIKNFELGNCVQKRMDLRLEVNPHFESLSKLFGETMHLAKQYEGEVVYLEKVTGSDFSIVSSQIGNRAPMYCTGVGKVMLAYLSEEYLEKYIFSKPMKKYTENTIITKEKLLEELENIRQKGYALDDEEIEIGLRCVAVPIFSQGKEILAGISISVPTGRMNIERIEEMKNELIKCSEQISRHMGM